MINSKEFKFQNQDRLLNSCVLTKADLDFIITHPTEVKFNLSYPAYINGFCYFESDTTSEEHPYIANLPGHWIYSDLSLAVYLYRFIQENNDKYETFEVCKLDLKHSKTSKFKL